MTRLCLIPQAYNVIDDQDWANRSWPLCTNEDEYYCMMGIMYTDVKKWTEVRL